MNTTATAKPSLSSLGPCPQDLDLSVILEAWQTATDRLQKTHEMLRDEVRRLSDELEIKNRELARKNRLADLGQMAAHVAHEVRNSMAPVTLYLSLLKRRVTNDAGCLGIMEKIETCFHALEATVTDLLQFTADREPVRERLEVRRFVSDLCETLSPQFEAQRIRPCLEISSGTTAVADPNMLRRALLNLVLNAVDAMPNGGDLVVTAVNKNSGLELEVADTGPGISAEVRRRIFEPFFTTKTEGTGLGLAIVQRIAEAHGGHLDVTNCPEGGAAFTLRIPARSKEAVA